MSRNEEVEAGEDDANQIEENLEELKRRYLLRRFWASGLGFWRRGGKRKAWLLIVGLVVVVLVNLVVQYGINVWNRNFFDALEKKDAAAVLTQGLIFPPLAAASVLLGVLAVYLRMTTQRTWRQWLNDHVVDYWLSKGRYFQLNLVGGDHKNPEYRIAEDRRLATDAPVDFAVGLLQAFLSASTFIVVLWTIGGSLSFEIGGTTMTIPGFLVIGAFIYAALASGLMVIIGRRFGTIAESKNQAEAEYRYVLTRLREKWRKHRGAWRREGGTRRPRKVAHNGVAPLARPLLPAHAHHHRLAGQRAPCAGRTHLALRAEISRRHNDAWPSHAGSFGLYDRANGI